MIQEAWIGGVSTRRVDDLVQAMGLAGISKSTGLQAVQGHRRAGRRLPRTARSTGEWPYLWLDATYLKAARGRPHRLGRGHNRRGRQHRRPARDRRPAHRPVGGRDLLVDFLRAPGERAASTGVKLVISDAHERAQGRDHAGLRRDLATLPRSLDPQRARPCAEGPAHRGRRRDPPGLHPARSQARRSRPGGTSPTSSAPAGRSSPSSWTTAKHDVLAYMTFPRQHRTKLHSHQPARAPEQGGQAPRRRRRHLPQRGLHHPPDRRRPARAERRVADPAPLHAGRSLRPDRHRGDRSPSQHNRQGRLTMHLRPHRKLHHLDGR